MPDKPVTYYNRPLDSLLGTTIQTDFSKELTLDHESEVPLTALLERLRSEPAETVEFKFAIGRFVPRVSTITANVPETGVGNDATWPVADPEYFVEGDIIECPSANVNTTHTEQVRVVSKSGSDLTVRPYNPAVFGVAAVSANATVRRIAVAMREKSSGRPSRQTVPTVYTQYCQSFEHYYDVTRIQEANRQYIAMTERARLQEEARKDHALDHEYAYFFAKKAKDTSFGDPVYQMDGLIAQIKSHLLEYSASNPLTLDALYDFMTKVHNPQYTGGMKRLVFASGDLLGEINKLANDAIRITTKESTFGPNITVLQFAGREWEFVEAPVLSEARPGWGVVTHPRFMKKRPLINTIFEMNVQNRIDKFIKDGFYSVDAIEVRLEEVFGLIKKT